MEKTGGSRLLQMQARFQQKQLQERELKIASLYEAQQARALDRVRHSPGNGVSVSPPAPPPAPTINHQPGKVRQMFEERRTKAGIDKSYPLQPIHNTERAQPKKTLTNGYNKATNTARTTERKTTKSHTSISTSSVKKHIVTKATKVDNMVNGSGDVNHNRELDFNNIDVPQRNGDVQRESYKQCKKPADEIDNAENNYMIENETFPEALAPISTPRSPEPADRRREQMLQDEKQLKRNPPRQSKSPPKVKPQAAVPSPRRSAAEQKGDSGSRSGMQRSANAIVKKTRALSGQTNGSKLTSSSAEGEACAVCGRRFAPDRLAKHQEICKKTSTKKRKPYDVLKHRLAGTEAEPFINKLRKNTPSTTKLSKNQGSWRQQHEEFIQAIRAAKKVQAHLSAGGKLSDLPPPPPSQNPDYVQCPHCSRRFNQAAADRHIPKCANFQFNKPKPPTKRR